MDLLFQGLIYAPVILYLLVQIAKDVRRQSYVMAGIGAICVMWIFASTPIQTHAIAIPLIPPR